MEDCGLMMLNLDENCIGEITREDRGHASTIDFALVNGASYENFRKMDSDEGKHLLDLSDHCLLRTDFSIGQRVKQDRAQKRLDYYSVREDLKVGFLVRMEEVLTGGDGEAGKFQDFVKKVSEELLKKTRTVRGNIVKKDEWEAVWMNEKIREQIRVRKRLNREKRSLPAGVERENAK